MLYLGLFFIFFGLALLLGAISSKRAQSYQVRSYQARTRRAGLAVPAHKNCSRYEFEDNEF